MPRHGRKLKNQFQALEETPPRTKKSTTKLVLGVWPPTRNLTGAEAPRVPKIWGLSWRQVEFLVVQIGSKLWGLGA